MHVFPDLPRDNLFKQIIEIGQVWSHQYWEGRDWGRSAHNKSNIYEEN